MSQTDSQQPCDVDASPSTECSSAPVDCLTDGHRWYSKSHPDRCVEELLFGGYAMYEKVDSEGVHRGLCSQFGAYQWLNGDPVDSIDGRLRVVGVTID